jgi:hypothetical protein
MSSSAAPQARRINWLNTTTVLSAAILIGTEVFGAAFAGSWALSNLLNLDSTVARVLDVVFLGVGAYIMFRFVQFARKVEPFNR